jgi:hypothetical protein
MRKGRQLAARLEAIAALESWAAQADDDAPAQPSLNRRQRRALGADCAAVDVAIRACRQQLRAPQPVVRCLARTLRERCRR